MKCHYIEDKELGRVFIPYCWGGLIYGKKNCHCEIDNEAGTIENRIKKLEEEVVRLNKIIKEITNKD